MKSLFVMDPLDRINVAGDSTYVTMLECTDRGLPCWMCVPSDLYSLDGRTFARATPVRTTESAPFFHTEDPVVLELGDFDAVWMRKDPPFDMDYIFTTYLLDMAPPSTLVLNRPDGLKLFNEKMVVQQLFPQFQPETLITGDIGQIRQWVAEQPGRVVLKPWDGNGGRGVLITDRSDGNLRSMIELLTEEGTAYVIAQTYLPGVVEGDKRILLFDGEVVGAMLRVPNPGDHRANMHAGAGVQRCELDDRDRQICDALRPVMKEWGMIFVGIDIIDGCLTEVNVTSPTGIRELNALYGTKLQADLVDCVQAKLGGER